MAAASATVVARPELLRLAKAATVRGDVGEARRLSEEALGLARAAADREAEVEALFWLLCACRNVGATSEAIGYLRSALRIAEEMGYKRWRGILLANQTKMEGGTELSKVRFFAEALEIADDVGDDDLWMYCQTCVGEESTMTLVLSVLSPLSAHVIGDRMLFQLLRLKLEASTREISEAVLERARSLPPMASTGEDQRQEVTRLVMQALSAKGVWLSGFVFEHERPVLPDFGHKFLHPEAGLKCLEEAAAFAHSSRAIRMRGGKQVFRRLGDAYVSRGDLSRADEAYRCAEEAFDEMWSTLKEDGQRRSCRDTLLPKLVGRARQNVLLKLGFPEAALVAAENSRARALAILLAEAMPEETLKDGCRLPSFADFSDTAKRENAAIVYYASQGPRRFLAWVVSPRGHLAGCSEIVLPCNAQDEGDEVQGSWSLLQCLKRDLGLRCRDELAEDDDFDVDTVCDCRVNIDDVERRLEEHRKRIREQAVKRQEQANQLLETLYDVLYRPLAVWVKDEPHVVIVPDADLYMVPFAALRDRMSGEYLAERHSIRRAPSIRTLQLLSERSQRASAPEREHGSALVAGVSQFRSLFPRTVKVACPFGVALGAALLLGPEALLVERVQNGTPLLKHNQETPTQSIRKGDLIVQVNEETSLSGMSSQLQFGGHLVVRVLRPWSNLLHVPDEVNAIHKMCQDSIMEVETLVDEEVLKDRLLKRMQEATEVIHLATHGVLEERALVVHGTSLEEALILDHEIASTALQACLAVLSACNTGLGNVGADGVVGLSRAFLVAGVRAVVVTLWSVDDRSTCLFMERFYRHWLAPGRAARAGTALQESMREVIRTRWDEGPLKGLRLFPPCAVGTFCFGGRRLRLSTGAPAL